MFAAAVGLILTIVIAFLSIPLWRKTRTSIPVGLEAFKDQERIDLEIEKKTLLSSLADLDLDLALSKFTQSDYERLKAVDERRLVNILNRIDELSNEKPEASARREQPAQKTSQLINWATSAMIGVLVIGSATGIYSYVQSRQRAEQVASQPAQQGQGMPNPLEMVARLEARLAKNPNDLEGQVMAGRSYMALDRTEDARKAWNKVLELDPRNHEAHFNLGVILLPAIPREDQKGLEAVLNHFEIAEIRLPTEPALLWYKGVTLVRLNRYREADDSWTTAFQNLMPGSEDAEFVKQALENLRAGNPPMF